MSALALSKRETKVKRDRLEKARQNLEKIQAEIAPFLKRRRVERASGLGKWIQTSDLRKK